MAETRSEYTLVDDEFGDEVELVIINRSCGCMSPGCVDDELQIHEDGEVFKMQVPRLIMPVIQGLLDGDYRLKE